MLLSTQTGRFDASFGDMPESVTRDAFCPASIRILAHGSERDPDKESGSVRTFPFLKGAILQRENRRGCRLGRTWG